MKRKPAGPLLVFVSALSAMILSCSAVANLPNLFATATPTATATLTPTITPSPIPTFTPTATPLPTGTVLRDAPGGGSRFFDYDGGYLIDVPSGWAAKLLKPEDMQAAISGVADASLNMPTSTPSEQDPLSEAYRMVAFDTVPAHFADGYVANFSVMMFQDRPSINLPLDLLVRASVDQMKRAMPGAQLNVLPTRVNLHSLRIGASDGKVSYNVPDHGPILMYQKQYYFQTKHALVVLELYAPESVSALVTPLFDKVFNGMQILGP